MDIQDLYNCDLVSDVEEAGTHILFKTYLYSPQTLSMHPVKVSCPLSGNYVLTESAEIVEGDIGINDVRSLLDQVFISLKGASRVEESEEEKRTRAILTGIMSSAVRYLSVQEISQESLERLRFDFLRICSQGFEEIYKKFGNNQKQHEQ